MIKPKQTARQRRLFQTGVTWGQLPDDVRRQLIAILATLCIELVDETQPSITKTKDERYGPTEN